MLLADFYSRTDGNDWSPAMDRALAMYPGRKEKIVFPAGRLRFTKPIEMDWGIALEGAGTVGSNAEDGTVLVACFDGADLIRWTGRQPFHGAGGLLRDVIVTADLGRSPSNAIVVTGSAPSRRAGFVTVERVVVYYGSDSGRFRCGLVIDGRAIMVPGSSGCRNVWVRGLFVSGCTDAAVEILNGVHCYVDVETAPSGGSGAVRVNEGAEDITISGRVYGDCYLGMCREVSCFAVASRLVVSPGAKEVRHWLLPEKVFAE